MKRLNFGAPPPDPQQFSVWATRALQEIERASVQDLATVADGFTITGTFTETRTLDGAETDAATIAAVLATFIQDIKNRGQKRSY